MNGVTFLLISKSFFRFNSENIRIFEILIEYLDDYDEDNFQMFWKLVQNGETQTVASWEPDAADEDSVIYYLQHSLENRVTVIPSFDGI